MSEPGPEEMAAAVSVEEQQDSGLPEPSTGPSALEQQLALARQEATDYLNRLARMQAEYENYRRRVQREREDTEQYAILALVRDLLPVLDNLERALAADIPDQGGGSEAALRTGVELTARQFREALEKIGIAMIPAVGEPFDPNWHEAVLRVEGDQEVPTIVEEFQKGYRLGNRLVRPSMVKVAAKG